MAGRPDQTGVPAHGRDKRSHGAYKPEGKHIPPYLVFFNDVIDEISELNEAIASETGVVEVWSAEFILRVKDIESDAQWRSYLNELSRAGKNRYVELWMDMLKSNCKPDLNRRFSQK